MKKLTRLFLPALLALGLFATALPAHAISGPVAVGVCPAGTASVAPISGSGLGLPVVHNSSHANWTITAGCTAVSVDGAESVTLSASGHLVGYCGFSSGTGTGNVGSNSLDSVSWASLGSQLHVHGEHSGASGFLAGLYVAEVNAQGGPACISDSATTFQVQIVSAFI